MRGEIDTRYVGAAGDVVRFRIDIDPDNELTAPFGDYLPHDAALFGQPDGWHYVGVTVTPIVAGEEIESCADSLWAVEYGQGDGWSAEVDDLVNTHPVPDMLGEVRSRLRDLAKQITDALSDEGRN